MARSLRIALVLAVILILTLPLEVAAQPPLPHFFCGNVTVDGSPAPVGTKVEARGTGVLTGIDGNPITTTVSGKYGDNSLNRLVVQGNITEGTVLTFYVNGVNTGQKYVFSSGELSRLNLAIFTPTGTTQLRIDVCGNIAYFNLDNNGRIGQNAEVSSPDGNVVISIAAGTALLDGESKPLHNLTVTPVEPPPSPPEGCFMLAAFDFEPNGTTFNPPMELTITYDPGSMPEGMSEENLVIAVFDEATDKWEFLECEVDAESNKVAVFISHLSVYGLLASPSSPAAPAASAPSHTVTTTLPLTETAPLAPSTTATATPHPTETPPPSTDGLGSSTWVGIGMGIGILAISGLAAGLWIIYKRRRQPGPRYDVGDDAGGSATPSA